MEELKKKFENALGSYQEVKRRIEARVVRWQWASGRLYHLEPFWFERHKIPRGRPLNKKPTRGEAYEYGFDEHDRVVVSRHMPNTKGHPDEEFFDYAGARIDTVFFGYDGSDLEVRNVTHYKIFNGLIANASQYGLMGSSREIYHYDGRRLTHIDVWQQDHGEESSSYRYEIDYDKLSFVTSIRSVSDGESYAVFTRPKGTAPLSELSSAVKDHLLQPIRELAPPAAEGAPVYCLALAYDDELELPPMLGLGLESERKEWLEKFGARKAKDFLWNPAEFRLFQIPALEIEDAQLLSLCKEFNAQLAQKNDLKPARKLLNELALQLNTADWTNILNATPDFIVFATDLEGSELQSNLKAGLPPAKLKILKEKGFL